MVRFLVDTASTYNPAFATVNYANEAGMRGIHYLCRGGHDVIQTNSLLEFLLTREGLGLDVNCRTGRGHTPLIISVSSTEVQTDDPSQENAHHERTKMLL